MLRWRCAAFHPVEMIKFSLGLFDLMHHNLNSWTPVICLKMVKSTNADGITSWMGH